MNQTAAVHKNSVMMNPMIRRLSRVEERDEDNCASYGGIAVKTIIFMLAAVAGFAAYFILHGMLAGSPTMEVQGYTFYQTEGIICAAALVLSFLAPFIALIIRPLIPLFGIIYCAGLGYSITLLGSVLGADYAELVFLALGLTILLVAVMVILYTTGIVKVTKHFRTVMLTLFLTAIISGIVGFLLSFIPGVSHIVAFFGEAPIFGIVLGVVYIIIACMFLLVDFDTIQRTVENKLPKKYEWAAAFGLAYTVIYLFLKIFNLICKLTQNNKNS